ncbi:MAG TPA: hypothetical protein VNC78_05000 [Actinomycetota bacterium]|nr:hypothetical protein [Actinomycetota bacterium]
MDNGRLTTRIRALAQHIDWPETPDIASAVAAELTLGPPRDLPAQSHTTGHPAWRRVLAAAAVSLIAAAGVLVASPAARHAVAEWIGVPGIAIRTVDETPSIGPRSPGRSLTELYRLGEPVSLSEAGERVEFDIVVPDGDVPPPTAVFFDPGVMGGAVSFLYAPDDLLPRAADEDVGGLFTQFQGRVIPEFGKKLVMSGAELRAVEVHGEPGYFISGDPHVIFYMGPDGEVAEDTARLAANTLLWSEGGVTYRFESALDLDDALAFVENLRAL